MNAIVLGKGGIQRKLKRKRGFKCVKGLKIERFKNEGFLKKKVITVKSCL